MILVPAVIVGGALVVAVADRPPVVNFEPTCRAAATGELRTDDRFETCVGDEKRARDQLSREWASFAPGARERCARMSTGHASSYIELLTCLEMDKSAGKRPGHDNTTGIFFTAPEGPVTEGSDATDPSQNRPGSVVTPRQQPVAAVPAPVVTPPPGPSTAPTPLSPPPMTSSPPPASPPPPLPAQAASQEDALYQSFCRSPFGYVLPNCH
jgi:hypothetical protein